MKRGNDKGQMSREDFEAEDSNEESESAGIFQRASGEELSKRRIVKTKRPSGSTNNTSIGSLGTFPTASPFASFTGLVPSTATSQPSKAPAPFSGLTGLTASSGKNTVNSNNNKLPNPSSLSSADGLLSEREKKIGKLNRAFLKWANKQIESKPLSIWKDGVKDYIKHMANIDQKYPDPEVLQQSTAAPAASNPPQLSSMSTTTGTSTSTGFSFGSTATSKDSNATNKSSKPNENGASVSSSSNGSSGGAIPSFSFTGGLLQQTSPTSAASSTSLLGKPTDDSTGNGSGGTAAAPFQFKFPPTSGGNKDARDGEVGKNSSSAFGGFGGFSFPKAPAVPAATSTASSSSSSSSTSSSTAFSFPPAAPAATSTGNASAASMFGASGSSFLSSAAPAPFSFSAAPNSNSFATTTTAAAAAGEEDEEGEPILEPEKVHKNEQDTDQILHEVPCKLFGFNKEAKEWRDTGKGTLRVTRAPGSTKQRMLIRNPIGKILFNASFFKGMKIEKLKKNNGLQFSAVVTMDDLTPAGSGSSGSSGKTELKGFMIKLNPANVDSTLSKLEAGIAAV